MKSLLSILLMALTGLAEGSVVVTPIAYPDGFVTQLSSSASPFRRRGLDLNQDGTEDFAFTATGAFYGIELDMTATNRITGFGYGEASLELGGFASSMPPLSIIGAETLEGAEWWNDGYGALLIASFDGAENSSLFLFGEHYVGLEFKVGDLTHYGYVKFEGRLAAVNIWETAWETEPGQPITIPLPEPAAGSFLAACTALAGLRRRRWAAGLAIRPRLSSPVRESSPAIG